MRNQWFVSKGAVPVRPVDRTVAQSRNAVGSRPRRTASHSSPSSSGKREELERKSKRFTPTRAGSSRVKGVENCRAPVSTGLDSLTRNGNSASKTACSKQGQRHRLSLSEFINFVPFLILGPDRGRTQKRASDCPRGRRHCDATVPWWARWMVVPARQRSRGPSPLSFLAGPSLAGGGTDVSAPCFFRFAGRICLWERTFHLRVARMCRRLGEGDFW